MRSQAANLGVFAILRPVLWLLAELLVVICSLLIATPIKWIAFVMTKAHLTKGLVGRALLGTVALMALSSYASASCNGGYRWSETKDGKTVTHYTQQPPEGRASECVQISTGTRSQVNAGEAADDAPAAKAAANGQPAAGQPADKKPKGIQGVPDKDPEKCKQAQDTKSVLAGHARIREKTDSGEYRYLTPEEITEQKKLADESSEVYCE